MLKSSCLVMNVPKNVPLAGKLTRTIIKRLNDNSGIPFDHHSNQTILQNKLNCPLTGQGFQLSHRLIERNRHGQRPNRITPVVTNNHSHTCQVRSSKYYCIKISLVYVKVRRTPLLYDLRTRRNQFNLPSMEKLLKNVACLPTNASHGADSLVKMNGISPIPNTPHCYSKNLNSTLILAWHKPSQ